MIKSLSLSLTLTLTPACLNPILKYKQVEFSSLSCLIPHQTSLIHSKGIFSPLHLYVRFSQWKRERQRLNSFRESLEAELVSRQAFTLMCKMVFLSSSSSLWHLCKVPAQPPPSSIAVSLSSPDTALSSLRGRERGLNPWPCIELSSLGNLDSALPCLTCPSPFCCAIISWVLLPLFAQENLPWFSLTRPESMLLKILDTFYLRAKACILCFDMVVLIRRAAEERGVGAGLVWQRSPSSVFLSMLSSSLAFLFVFPSLFCPLHIFLLLSVSGNAAILNGFLMLALLVSLVFLETSYLWSILPPPPFALW